MMKNSIILCCILLLTLLFSSESIATTTNLPDPPAKRKGFIKRTAGKFKKMFTRKQRPASRPIVIGGPMNVRRPSVINLGNGKVIRRDQMNPMRNAGAAQFKRSSVASNKAAVPKFLPPSIPAPKNAPPMSVKAKADLANRPPLNAVHSSPNLTTPKKKESPYGKVPALKDPNGGYSKMPAAPGVGPKEGKYTVTANPPALPPTPKSGPVQGPPIPKAAKAPALPPTPKGGMLKGPPVPKEPKAKMPPLPPTPKGGMIKGPPVPKEPKAKAPALPPAPKGGMLKGPPVPKEPKTKAPALPPAPKSGPVQGPAVQKKKTVTKKSTKKKSVPRGRRN